MPGAFQGINIAGSALRAFQTAMQVTGNNLANVNTRGYTRQTVDMRQTEPTKFWSYGEHQIGTGVAVGAISRAKDMFQETRMRSALSNQGRSDAMKNTMAEIEGVYNEPGANGLSSTIDAFFNSWSALSSNPNDSSARWNVRQNALTLTSRVRNTYAQLDQQEDGANQAIKDTISTINSLTSNIADLNAEIREAMVTGAQPSSLLDTRDQMVRELSSLTEITTTNHADGSLSIYTGNLPLVLQTESRPIPMNFDSVNHTVTSGTTTYSVRGGQLQGNMDAVQRIKAAKVELDKLANEFKTAFNTVHKTGINALGNTNVNFFNDVTTGPQTGAKDFDLSAEVAADPKAIVTSVTGAAGDGGLALSMSKLKDLAQANLGGVSITQYYRDHVGGISQEAAYYDQNASIQADIVGQIDQQIESVSGVSLDEEMIDLQRYQRSYQAAARVLSIMDQTTEDLINLIR